MLGYIYIREGNGLLVLLYLTQSVRSSICARAAETPWAKQGVWEHVQLGHALVLWPAEATTRTSDSLPFCLE